MISYSPQSISHLKIHHYGLYSLKHVGASMPDGLARKLLLFKNRPGWATNLKQAQQTPVQPKPGPDEDSHLSNHISLVLSKPIPLSLMSR